MPVGKGYPKKTKVKGKTRYRMHKGGKAYTAKQMRLYFATKGFTQMRRATRLRRRKSATKRRRR